MANGADTITPPGDGKDTATEVAEAVAVGSSEPNISAEEYTTKGQTKVATRRGYRFVPSDKKIPVVTSDGIMVTSEQAEALAAESKGLVSEVPTEKKE